jgi:hypothetical protein
MEVVLCIFLDPNRRHSFIKDIVNCKYSKNKGGSPILEGYSLKNGPRRRKEGRLSVQ